MFNGNIVNGRCEVPDQVRNDGRNKKEYGKEKEIASGRKALRNDAQRAERGRAVAAERLLVIARKDLNVREEGCGNCGRRVEECLKYVGFGKGAAWCAAAVSMWFREAGFPAPRTAWSPSMFPNDRVVEVGEIASNAAHFRNDGKGAKGLVLGIYFPSLKRIAHVGLVEDVRGDFITSIEGNTNIAGSRNGDGVYRKIRHRRTIYKYADWL